MNTHTLQPSTVQDEFCPGDRVVRYEAGRPVSCVVVGVESDERVRVSSVLWPSGYTALVGMEEIVLLEHNVQ